MSRGTIALVGDRSDAVTAHRAIPKALDLARAKSGADLAWEWVPTRRIREASRDLEGFSGLWLVPASPYENTEGAIEAVRWAREGMRPIIGTCGGFQHMMIEFARNAAGIPDAHHEETDPDGSDLVVTRLACSLVEKSGAVHFAGGSLLHRAYGSDGAVEGYRCNYGLNPSYRPAIEAAGLRFTAWDDAGDVRGAELPNHPFFAGVLFQPERAALTGAVPPLALAFVCAVSSACGPGPAAQSVGHSTREAAAPAASGGFPQPPTMTEAGVVRMMRRHFEGLFPKECPGCGRRFETMREYILGTRRSGSAISYDAELGDWNSSDPIGTLAHADCPCGNTLALSTAGRPVSEMHMCLEWLRSESLRQGLGQGQLIDRVRSEIRRQVLADTPPGDP